MTALLETRKPRATGEMVLALNHDGMTVLAVEHDIARLIVELNRRTGRAVVLVEQNIDMIRMAAQRCFVMDKGRIITALTPAMLDDRDIIRRHLAV